MKKLLAWLGARLSPKAPQPDGFDFSAFLKSEPTKDAPQWSDPKGRLQFEVNRGVEVSALLNNEVVRSTVTGILHAIQNEWLTEVRADQRELMWQQAQGVQKFVASLGSIVDTGKMAAYQLKAMENEQTDNQA